MCCDCRQCSECVSSSSEDSDDPDVDTEAPRKLREKIKCPTKFTPIIKEKKVPVVKQYSHVFKICPTTVTVC